MICWPAQRGQRESAHARTFARFSIRFSLSFSLSLYYIHKKGKNEERKKNIYTFLASFLDWLCADRNAGVLPPPCLVFSLSLSLRPPPQKKNHRGKEPDGRSRYIDRAANKQASLAALGHSDGWKVFGQKKETWSIFFIITRKTGRKKI